MKEHFKVFDNLDNVYLDSASTTQKPTVVLEAMDEFYTAYCSNVHRSSSHLANRATIEYEGAREKVRAFIGAKDCKEIIFTKGVTESINFVACSFVRGNYENVIISSLEHHSNIVPWHMQGRNLTKGLKVVDIKENLEFDYEHFEKLLQETPNAFVSIAYVSNAFGVVHDIKRIAKMTHQYGALILVDGAQSTPHIPIDVQDLGIDFYTFSSHKTYGPMGVGVLYANEKCLASLKPYQGGGGSIYEVDYDCTRFADSPICYESGTPNIAEAIGLGRAIDFLTDIGLDYIVKHEKELSTYLLQRLNEIDGVQTYSALEHNLGSYSFNIKDINANDIGLLLDGQKIAIRYGNHCAQPIMKKLGISGTLRVSIALYSDREDIDKLIKALKRAISMLS